MLAKKNRLKKKKEFNFIYKKGEVFYCKFLALYKMPTKLKDKKIGFSVSNKVGNSVVRHKVKRKLSEVVRLNINLLPLNNYIFVAKQGSENLSSDQLKENVFYLLKKAKILQEEN